MGVSLKPSKQVSGGGFLNDVVADWVDPVWQIHDYNGKAKATTALCVTFHPEEGDITEQFFSAGSPDRLAPSSDGKTPAGTGAGTKGQYLVAVRPGIEGLTKNCVAAKLLTSLIEAGFPEDRIDDSGDATVFAGLKTRLVQVPAKNLDGTIRKRKGKDGNEYDATDTIVSEIVQFPWDAKTDAAGAKGAEAAAGETELEDEAVSGVLALIGDAPVSRGKIASLLFPALKKDGKDVKTINAIIKIANSEDFLKAKAEEGMWKYAKQTVSSG